MVEATPEDAMFTKEDLEMWEGLIKNMQRDTEYNIIEWIDLQSQDPAKIEGFINFINLRKTGQLRLEHKRLMLEYLQKDIDGIIEKKDEIIRQLGAIATFDPNVEAVSFPLDPSAIVRLVAIIAFKSAVLLALSALMIEMELLLLDRWVIKDDILQRPLIEII